MNHWILISAISGIVLGIVCSAPQLAHLPYEYFHELYNHYGDSIQNNIEDMKRVHEEHQEIQHRVHEKYQEHYYNIREKIQERDENYHESLEKSNEEIRSSSGTRKSLISNSKVNPRIAEKEAKSFLQKNSSPSIDKKDEVGESKK